MDMPPEIAKIIAAPAGSAIALIWLPGTLVKRAAMFAAGWGVAAFLSPPMAAWLHMAEGSAGFMMGLFSVAVVDKVFNTWQQFDLGALLMEWARGKLGLDKKTEVDKP